MLVSNSQSESQVRVKLTI